MAEVVSQSSFVPGVMNGQMSENGGIKRPADGAGDTEAVSKVAKVIPEKPENGANGDHFVAEPLENGKCTTESEIAVEKEICVQSDSSETAVTEQNNPNGMDTTQKPEPPVTHGGDGDKSEQTTQIQAPSTTDNSSKFLLKDQMKNCMKLKGMLQAAMSKVNRSTGTDQKSTDRPLLKNGQTNLKGNLFENLSDLSTTSVLSSSETAESSPVNKESKNSDKDEDKHPTESDVQDKSEDSDKDEEDQSTESVVQDKSEDVSEPSQTLINDAEEAKTQEPSQKSSDLEDNLDDSLLQSDPGDETITEEISEKELLEDKTPDPKNDGAASNTTTTVLDNKPENEVVEKDEKLHSSTDKSVAQCESEEDTQHVAELNAEPNKELSQNAEQAEVIDKSCDQPEKTDKEGSDEEESSVPTTSQESVTSPEKIGADQEDSSEKITEPKEEDELSEPDAGDTKVMDDAGDEDIEGKCQVAAPDESKKEEPEGTNTETKVDLNKVKLEPDMKTENDIKLEDVKPEEDVKLDKDVKSEPMETSETLKTEIKDEHDLKEVNEEVKQSLEEVSHTKGKRSRSGTPDEEIGEPKRTRLDEMIGKLESQIGVSSEEIKSVEDSQSDEGDSSDYQSGDATGKVKVSSQALDKLIKKKMAAFFESAHNNMVSQLMKKIKDLQHNNEVWKNQVKELQQQLLELSSMQHTRLDRRRGSRVATRHVATQMGEGIRSKGAAVQQQKDQHPTGSPQLQKTPPRLSTAQASLPQGPVMVTGKQSVCATVQGSSPVVISNNLKQVQYVATSDLKSAVQQAGLASSKAQVVYTGQVTANKINHPTGITVRNMLESKRGGSGVPAQVNKSPDCVRVIDLTSDEDGSPKARATLVKATSGTMVRPSVPVTATRQMVPSATVVSAQPQPTILRPSTGLSATQPINIGAPLKPGTYIIQQTSNITQQLRSAQPNRPAAPGAMVMYPSTPQQGNIILGQGTTNIMQGGNIVRGTLLPVAQPQGQLPRLTSTTAQASSVTPASTAVRAPPPLQRAPGSGSVQQGAQVQAQPISNRPQAAKQTSRQDDRQASIDSLKNKVQNLTNEIAQKKASVAAPPDDDSKCDDVVMLKHPAPLPLTPPNTTEAPDKKCSPPKPSLKISRVSQGIVLSWNMALTDKHSDITEYQLYAYQEGTAPPSSSLWKKVGDVKALPLPMACTLTQFQEGNRYHFAVRAIDKHKRIGPFSEVNSIHLTSKTSS